MRLPGRLSAAIEVLESIEVRRRPVSEALKDWGNANRFAGAGDRAAIGNLVYDALRKKASHAFRMGSDVPRALVLAVAVHDWGQPLESLAAEGERFAPAPLSEDEAARLRAPDALDGAPMHIRADIPEWAVPAFEAAFGPDWVREGQGFTERPPLDLRANRLKSTRDRVLKGLQRFNPEPTPIAWDGVRMPAGAGDSRTPNVQADEGYIKGWFEVQDAGSQIVSRLAGVSGGEQVLDLCAGGGGKTLAMAADMGNRGQIFAYDSERPRLALIYERLKRNGVRNAQVRPPDSGALNDLVARMDLVLVDAPCTGTGTWRRHPHAKWKLTPEQVGARVREQAAILDHAATFVKGSGALAYITCSVLPDENDGQVLAFLQRHPEFRIEDGRAHWQRFFPEADSAPYFTPAGGIMLTPARTGTDGFYTARLVRG